MTFCDFDVSLHCNAVADQEQSPKTQDHSLWASKQDQLPSSQGLLLLEAEAVMLCPQAVHAAWAPASTALEPKGRLANSHRHPWVTAGNGMRAGVRSVLPAAGV